MSKKIIEVYENEELYSYTAFLITDILKLKDLVGYGSDPTTAVIDLGDTLDLRLRELEEAEGKEQNTE